MGKVLVVEDDLITRNNIINLYDSLKHEIFSAGKIAEADEILGKHDIDVVLLDIELGGTISGIDYIDSIHKISLNTQVIMVTKYDDLENIIEATKKGAFYYLIKPIDPQEILILTEKALKISEQEKKANFLEKENKLLKQRLELSEHSKRSLVIGKSPQIIEIQKQLNQVIEYGTDTNILLSGESGVGKEVFARYICEMAAKKSNGEIPFIAVNCASIPENLFESEFFGHERGAFTGADKMRHGFFELAQGGYIFLDEISDMPMDFQAKLLRVIEEKQIRRIGGSKTIKCDFKLITAANQNLKKRIGNDSFREDLYYRISTINFEIPPLRNRPTDIPLLVEHFVNEKNQKSKRQYPPINSDIMNHLQTYPWPGNVRELKNTVERLLILGFDGASYKIEVLLEVIGDNSEGEGKRNDKTYPLACLHEKVAKLMQSVNSDSKVDYKQFLTSLEKDIFEAALVSSDNNGVKAAKLLGLRKSTFYNRLRSLEDTT